MWLHPHYAHFIIQIRRETANEGTNIRQSLEATAVLGVPQGGHVVVVGAPVVVEAAVIFSADGPVVVRAPVVVEAAGVFSADGPVVVGAPVVVEAAVVSSVDGPVVVGAPVVEVAVEGAAVV